MSPRHLEQVSVNPSGPALILAWTRALYVRVLADGCVMIDTDLAVSPMCSDTQMAADTTQPAENPTSDKRSEQPFT